MSREFNFALGKKVTWPHFPPNFPAPGSLTYDDALLVPQLSAIETRTQVDTSVIFGPYCLKTPVVSSPMDTITGENMARVLADLGAIGSLPRGNLNQRLGICERLSNDNVPCVYAISLKQGLPEAKALKERGAKMVLIDVAHGGMNTVIDLAKSIKNQLDLWVIAGNIVSFEQAQAYSDKNSGIDIARVGVGPGGLCTTRIKTGTGFPQLSAIFETTSTGLYVIADGGIQYSGDVAKAIAAGANMVMIGSMLAGTDETPGEVDANGHKLVRGQASASYMESNGVLLDNHRTDEGITALVEAKGPVKRVIDDITGGLRSAMSYAGAENITEFQKMAVFQTISPSVQKENRPHILEKH